jgi:hypothetical protein
MFIGIPVANLIVRLAMTENIETKRRPAYQLLKMLLKLIYPRHAIAGAGNVLAGRPAVFVANHLESYAPIVMMLYFPYQCRPWVHAAVMDKVLCRDYLEEDFTRKTLRLKRPLSRWLASAIAPLCIWVMRSAEAIPVYRSSMRIRETFSQSVNALESGKNLLIFPERNTLQISNGLQDFHTGFIHLAGLYERSTGQKLLFYPVHVDNNSKTITISEAVKLASDFDHHQDRQQIAADLHRIIEEMAEQSGATA